MRVVRLLVYAGSEEKVAGQLGRSLPDGVRKWNVDNSLTIITLRTGWFSRLRAVVGAIFS